MTIKEFIEHLKKLDQDALVLRFKNDGCGYCSFDSYDGWRPQYVDVKHDEYGAGKHYEATSDYATPIRAIYL